MALCLMSAARIIGNLLWLANDDLDDARRLRAKRNAAYHLEQAAEKALKAVLVSEGIASGAGHQLGQLARQVPDENPYKARLLELDRFTIFATTYRYVTSSGRLPSVFSAEDLERALSDVGELVADLASEFEADLTRPDIPAKSPRPIRTT